MANDGGGEVGRSGLNYSGNEVTEELHPNLTGRKALETWRAMKDNDPLVGAILFAIDMLVRQVEWRVDKKDAKDADAQFLEECMDDMSMSWGDFISEVLSMLPFGFAFHEIVYKQRQGYQPEDSEIPSSRFSDGKVGWRKLPLRAQDTLDHWQFDDNGGLKAFVQRSAPDYVEVPIPMQKGLLFRTSVYKNNPEGRSLLRTAYASWFYKKRLQQIEGTGIERDMAGFPVFWLPAQYLSDNATAEEKAVLQAFNDLGKNIRRDKSEFLIMPLAYDENGNKAFDFELTASAGQRTFDIGGTIERYNKEIAMSVLADFILLGHENVGSFALSSDKTDLFAVALGTILDSIADVLNRYAVPRLFELNGLPTENLPEIAHEDIESPNLTDLGTYLGALVNAGVPLFPDEELEAWLRQVGGMPEKSEEAKRLQEEARLNAQAQFGGGPDPTQAGAAGGPPGPAGSQPPAGAGSDPLAGL